MWIALLTPLLIMAFALVMEGVEAPFTRHDTRLAGRLSGGNQVVPRAGTRRGAAPIRSHPR